MKSKSTFLKIAGAIVMIILLTGFGMNTANAQGNGEIKVNVLDEDGDPAMGSLVSLLSGNQLMERKTADDGTVTFKEVLPGTYDVKVEMLGKKTYLRTGIIVSANKTNYVNTKLAPQLTELTETVIEPDKKSMVQETMSSGQTIDEMQFKHSATERGNVISMIVAVTPGVMPTADGKDLYSRGARRGTMQYMIDGEKVIGSFNVPSQSVRGMTVYTGGVPACYGDFTGGLVMVTTKSFFNGLQSKKQMYEEINKHKEEMDEWQEEQKNKNVEEKKEVEK